MTTNDTTPGAANEAVSAFVADYEFRFDEGGGYTPDDRERAMIEDAINGYLADHDATPPSPAQPGSEYLHDAASHRDNWSRIFDRVIADESHPDDISYFEHEKKALLRLLDAVTALSGASDGAVPPKARTVGELLRWLADVDPDMPWRSVYWAEIDGKKVARVTGSVPSHETVDFKTNRLAKFQAPGNALVFWSARDERATPPVTPARLADSAVRLLDEIDAEIEQVRQMALQHAGTGIGASFEEQWRAVAAFRDRVLKPKRAAGDHAG